MIAHGKVQDGKLTQRDPWGWQRILKRLEGKEVVIEVKKVEKGRSTNQNDYYFGVVCKLYGEWIGLLPSDMHKTLAAKLLSIPIEGTDLVYIRSTTALSTVEFEDYMRNCRMLASHDGVYIPEPNEQELLSWIE